MSKDTIQRARESLPLEFGTQLVNETGREVLLVRVPKAKPDYLHDLGDVAFYVNLDTIRNCKDVLLIGHEKTARVEPQLLRDNIRAQDREDADLVSDLRRRLGRDYAASVIQSPSNFQHQALAVRIPKAGIADFGAGDVKAIRDVVTQQGNRFAACQYAFILADRDHERLGRRMLLELLGQPPQVPANQQPLSPVVPTAAPPAAAAPVSGGLFGLPMTPGSQPASAVPAASADASTGALPAFLAAKTHSVAPAPVASAPAPVAQSPAPIAAPVPTAPSPPPAPPAPATVEVDDRDEYAIITRKPAAAPAPAAPTPTPAAPAADITDAGEYEIVSKPKPVEAAAPAAKSIVEGHPDVERSVSASTEAYEVYTSKPKTPKPAAGPSITPPGQGGFQAALDAATGAMGGHAPPKTKEYEIMGASKPSVLSSPVLAPRPAFVAAAPVATAPVLPSIFQHAPAPVPAVPSPPPAPQAPVDDPRIVPAFAASAAPAIAVVPKVTLAPEVILAQKFRDSGYEIVESLKAQGTVFAFAAHKSNGRRVLAKRATEFGPEDAATLAQLVAALGADICLVVADKVQPGTRLATWGTRIEAYSVSDVASLSF